MLRLTRFVLLFCLSTSVAALAQDVPGEDESPPVGITTGFMIKGGYAANPWRSTIFSNLPASLRTVNYGNTPYAPLEPYTFTQDQLKLHSEALMLPIELGPTLNIGNRIELAGGGAATIDNDYSNRMQLGCYCVELFNSSDAERRTMEARRAFELVQSLLSLL